MCTYDEMPHLQNILGGYGKLRRSLRHAIDKDRRRLGVLGGFGAGAGLCVHEHRRRRLWGLQQ